MIYASTSWLNNNLDMKKLSRYQVAGGVYNDTVTYKGFIPMPAAHQLREGSGNSATVDLNY